MTSSTRPEPATNSLAGWPRPLAFVLSGGGSYGAAQIGMIRALVEAGVLPDLVVGSSVGALNGAVVAADAPVAAERLEHVWSGVSRASLFGGGSRLKMAWTFARWRKSLCPPGALQSVIDAWLPVERFEQLAVPLASIVTDVATGEAALLTSGALAPALLASAAIPGVYPPIQLDGQWYVDGGVTANVPVRQAIAFGARSLVVLNANPASLTRHVPTTILGAMMRASVVMLRSQRADAVDTLAGSYPMLYLPQVTPPSLSSFDFDHTPALIDAGYRHSRDLLASMSDAPSSTLPSPPD
jgi:NTE family protein